MGNKKQKKKLFKITLTVATESEKRADSIIKSLEDLIDGVNGKFIHNLRKNW